MTLRSFARYLRVVLTCVALAVACPAVATAAPYVDVSAWIAESDAQAPACGDVPASPSPCAPKDLRPTARAPGAARTRVVRSRLYLRHEALLC